MAPLGTSGISNLSSLFLVALSCRASKPLDTVPFPELPKRAFKHSSTYLTPLLRDTGHPLHTLPGFSLQALCPAVTEQLRQICLKRKSLEYSRLVLSQNWFFSNKRFS